MLESIRIENLRSIKDTGFVTLAPLTILVGQNSSGKSTFLRSFPLLAQSVSKRLRGPVSWFDANSVDFGDYQTARNRFADGSIKFSFKFNVERRRPTLFMRNFWMYSRMRHFRSISDFRISLSLNEDNNGTYIDNISFVIDDYLTVDMKIEKRDSLISFSINNSQVTEFQPKFKFSFQTDLGIVPSLISPSDKETPGKFLDTACTILKNYCDKRFKNTKKLKGLFVYINGYSREALLNSLRNTTLVTLKRTLTNWSVETPEFQTIYKLFIMSEIPNFLMIANSYIYEFYSECGYIAPSRAEALRYYRNQELQVDDVDPYGRNLQEFISSMNIRSNRYESFTKFVEKILGVKITVHNSTGHQSLYISKDNNEFNLADVGFGYSQILPVITKLWHATQNPRSKYNDEVDIQRCVVMEQPELHLHPALQAKIADAFIITIHEAKKNKVNLKLIIETHSPTIINRIGKRIGEQTVHKDDVSVLLFEKKNKFTQVCSTSFKENGQIEGWPMGFFSPHNETLTLE